MEARKAGVTPLEWNCPNMCDSCEILSRCNNPDAPTCGDMDAVLCREDSDEGREARGNCPHACGYCMCNPDLCSDITGGRGRCNYDLSPAKCLSHPCGQSETEKCPSGVSCDDDQDCQSGTCYGYPDGRFGGQSICIDT